MLGYLVIQPDWHIVLREPSATAWIGFKKKGEQGVYGQLKSSGKADDGTPQATCTDGFSIYHITKNSITIGNGAVRTEFRAPKITYTTIHDRNKHVQCLDVTNSGLGLSCDLDGKLRVWETSSAEVRRELKGHVADVYSCRFFPSGVVALSAGADMSLRVWDVTTGRCAASIIGHSMAITDTAIVERGRNIISSSRDGTAKLWCVASGRCLATFEPELGQLNACAVGPVDNSTGIPASEQHDEEEFGTGGKLLLTACEDKCLCGYALQARQKIFSVPTNTSVTCCCFLNSTSVAYGTHDGLVATVDLRKSTVPLFQLADSASPVLSLTATDNSLFVSHNDGRVYRLNSAGQCELDCTGSDCDPVNTTAEANGQLFTGCRDGSIRVYNIS